MNQSAINATENLIRVWYRSVESPYTVGHSQYVFRVGEGIAEPFVLGDLASLKAFVRNAAKFTLQFSGINFVSRGPDNMQQEEHWSIAMEYEVSSFQRVEAEITAEMERMDTVGHDGVPLAKVQSGGWLVHAAVFALAVVSLLLQVKYIADMVTLYTQMKFKSTRFGRQRTYSEQHRLSLLDEYERQFLQPEQEWMEQFDIRGHKAIARIIAQQRPWQLLTLTEKLLFIDTWVLLTIAANVLQAFTCLLLLFQNNALPLGSIQLFTGFSCFMAWMSACRYVEFLENVYILTYLLKYSLPMLLRFMVTRTRHTPPPLARCPALLHRLHHPRTHALPQQLLLRLAQRGHRLAHLPGLRQHDLRDHLLRRTELPRYATHCKH